MAALDSKLPLQESFKIMFTAQEKGKTLPLILCSLPMIKSVYYKNKKEIHINSKCNNFLLTANS